jgi:hypothetical protein
MNNTKQCDKCIHYNVCFLRHTLDIDDYRFYFGGYAKFVVKLASICEEFKEC